MNNPLDDRGTSSVDGLLAAVTAVWEDVLGVTGIGPYDAFYDRCDDIRKANRVVALLNQWLGSRLTVMDLLEHAEPAALSVLLDSRGVAAPALAGAVSSVGDASAGTAVDSWRAFWDATYRFSKGADFDTAGWFDNHTLSPLPRDHMAEWVSATVDRIRTLPHRRVLDIGCGTGLLLFPLARDCERYVGLDFSREVIERLRRRTERDASLAHVDIVRGTATDSPHLLDGPFDLIVINSVAQCFPDLGYLREVLTGAARLLTADGSLFLGDVRNALLKGAFHTALVTARGHDEEVGGPLLARIEESIASDTQLQLSPGELTSLWDGVAEPPAVHALVRRGAHRTEMNQYRYDAVFRFGTPEDRVGPVEVQHHPWAGSSALAELLGQLAEGAAVVVRGVPDSRTFDAVCRWEVLTCAGAGLDCAPVDVERLWTDGRAAGCDVAVGPSDVAGRVDAAFVRGGDDWSAARLLR